jgi:Domain of unknown function (DUF2431)
MVESRQRDVLILGDGNFTFALSLIGRYPEYASRVVVTEYDNEDTLRKDSLFLCSQYFLQSLKVPMKFSIDATKLETHFPPNTCFPFIYFNNPFVCKGRGDGSTKKLVYRFFESARNIQLFGGTIHIALSTSPKSDRWDEVYGLTEATIDNGYKMIQELPFKTAEKSEFSFYQHRVSTGNESTEITGDMKMYVFQMQKEEDNLNMQVSKLQLK